MYYVKATSGRNSVSSAISYSQQEQLQKLKTPPLIQTKADEKIGPRVLKNKIPF